MAGSDEEVAAVEIHSLSATGLWTPQRVRILDWLKTAAPAVAQVYEGAVRLAMDHDFPGRVWFAAHALRDMRNRLPDAIAGPVKGSRTEYSELAVEVTKRWIEDGLPSDGTSPVEAASEPTAGSPNRVEVSVSLLNAVADLVAGHLAIGPRKQESARRLFTEIAGQPVPDYAVRAWLDTTGRAEKFAHLRTKPLTPEDQREFEEIFLACEGALSVMASRSYENMDEIDEILDSAKS
jgi:hypothetical protein